MIRLITVTDTLFMMVLKVSFKYKLLEKNLV